MNTALTWFIRGWLGLVILLNIASVGIIIARAPSFWDAWSYITSIYSPYNLKNYGMEVLLCSPAIAAEVWRQKRAQRP